jgi:hypothetical protein
MGDDQSARSDNPRHELSSDESFRKALGLIPAPRIGQRQWACAVLVPCESPFCFSSPELV